MLCVAGESGVKGPSSMLVLLLLCWAPFSVFCMHLIYVQAARRCSRHQDLQQHYSPDTSLHWDSTPYSSFLRGNSHLQNLGWAIAVSAPSPGSSSILTAPLRAGGITPTENRRKLGPGEWPQPHLGRAILAGASGCLEPPP